MAGLKAVGPELWLLFCVVMLVNLVFVVVYFFAIAVALYPNPLSHSLQIVFILF